MAKRSFKFSHNGKGRSEAAFLQIFLWSRKFASTTYHNGIYYYARFPIDVKRFFIFFTQKTA